MSYSNRASIVIQLLVKLYDHGAMSQVLSRAVAGNELMCTLLPDPFDFNKVRAERFIFIAGGTGLTLTEGFCSFCHPLKK